MHKKLGIIAGGGAIPRDLINFCKENKRDYFVIAIEGNADRDLIDETIPHAWIRIGQAGTSDPERFGARYAYDSFFCQSGDEIPWR